LEEFVDMAFALLQWSMWISSQTRLASPLWGKCDAEFVEIFTYVHKCEGVAIIIQVFGVEVTEFRKNEMNSCKDFGSVGNLQNVYHIIPFSIGSFNDNSPREVPKSASRDEGFIC
jgi:hypothetical protein